MEKGCHALFVPQVIAGRHFEGSGHGIDCSQGKRATNSQSGLLAVPLLLPFTDTADESVVPPYLGTGELHSNETFAQTTRPSS